PRAAGGPRRGRRASRAATASGAAARRPRRAAAPVAARLRGALHRADRLVAPAPDLRRELVRAPRRRGRAMSARSSEERRRLAEIFGDVLPEQTSDDRDPDARREAVEERERAEEWLRRQVPPHHG